MFVYFICVVLLGAIIVINLFLAVLCDNFDMANKLRSDLGLEIVADLYSK